MDERILVKIEFNIPHEGSISDKTTFLHYVSKSPAGAIADYESVKMCLLESIESIDNTITILAGK